jgi:hypothetical protein
VRLSTFLFTFQVCDFFSVNKDLTSWRRRVRGSDTLQAKLAKERVTRFPWKSNYLTIKISMVNFVMLPSAGSMQTF